MAKKQIQYTGCISHIEQARKFAREFLVYGLKAKVDYCEDMDISPRTYDEATRRMNDWFRDCVQTKTVNIRNKVKYLSLNSRDYSANPLYKIWKAKSFTSNELMFFFSALNYLTRNQGLQAFEEIYANYSVTVGGGGFSETAARKWMKNKGCQSGIIINENRKYRLAATYNLKDMADLLSYYSEIAPSGVIGSFIMDKQDDSKSPFGFKQNYIGRAFDCEIMCNVLHAIKNDRDVKIEYRFVPATILPMKVYSSTQNGRQYLIAWNKKDESFYNYRIDRIDEIQITDFKNNNATEIRGSFDKVKKHIWGVSLGEGKLGLTHIEFVIRVEENEAYIINRLNREKRCGTVTVVENCPGRLRFKADVYDAHEMFPWIRTFICRIEKLSISDVKQEEAFWRSVEEMYDLYSVKEINYEM